MIMVLVQHISKYGHFCVLPHPFTYSSNFHVFHDWILKLYGMPISIVLHCDPTFISKFLQELLKLQRIQLKMSIAYHPK
jgi:hypothetical protein